MHLGEWLGDWKVYYYTSKLDDSYDKKKPILWLLLKPLQLPTPFQRDISFSFTSKSRLKETDEFNPACAGCLGFPPVRALFLVLSFRMCVGSFLGPSLLSWVTQKTKKENITDYFNASLYS